MLGYVKNGMVADLSDSVDFSLMTEDAMKLSTVDDKQYSVPWLTMDTRACFYNKDMFEKMAGKFPEPSANLRTFWRRSRKLVLHQFPSAMVTGAFSLFGSL